MKRTRNALTQRSQKVRAIVRRGEAMKVGIELHMETNGRVSGFQHEITSGLRDTSFSMKQTEARLNRIKKKVWMVRIESPQITLKNFHGKKKKHKQTKPHRTPNSESPDYGEEPGRER